MTQGYQPTEPIRSEPPKTTVTDQVKPKSREVRPDYYKCGNLECFDILWYMSDDMFDICNAVKYIFRAGEKTTVSEDLKKAITCLKDGMRGDDRPLGASKREVFKSELPDWKICLITYLMDMANDSDDDYRKERYAAVIEMMEQMLDHWKEVE